MLNCINFNDLKFLKSNPTTLYMWKIMVYRCVKQLFLHSSDVFHEWIPTQLEIIRFC